MASLLQDLRRLLDRALFDPRAPDRPDRLLGLLILALVAIGAWLILWPFIPTLISGVAVGLIDLVSAPWTPSAPTPIPTPIPSPSPSPTP